MENSFLDKFPNAEGITPNLARQDHYNEIHGLVMCMDPAISGPVSNELFWKRLREWADHGKGFIMRSFSQKFPPDKYPGIIDCQPPGVVARFDAIAQEINGLYIAGQLTEDRLREVKVEMNKLCYE